MEKSEKKSKIKGINHFYVPPPARKLEGEGPHQSLACDKKNRGLESKVRNSTEETKICNNSSLLFKTNHEEPRLVVGNEVCSKRKRKRKIKKQSDNVKDGTNEEILACPSTNSELDTVPDICLNLPTIPAVSSKSISNCEKKKGTLYSDSLIIEHFNKNNLYQENNDNCSSFIAETNTSDLPDNGDDEELFFECSSEEIPTEIPLRSDESNETLGVNDSSLPIIDSNEIPNPDEHNLNNAFNIQLNLHETCFEITQAVKSSENNIEPVSNNEPCNVKEENIISENSENDMIKIKAILNESSNSVENSDESDDEFCEWEKLLEDEFPGLEIRPTKVLHGDENLSDPKLENDEKEGNDSSIIEIYGFPEEFKTRDLLMPFTHFMNRGFKLIWVDNTHALGIFSSSVVADEALSLTLPSVKTRPLSEGTPASKDKAKHVILPATLRPKTCAALARRLVSGALGVKPVFTQAEREAEREMLKEAREQKRLAAKQREAAWEGKF